MSERGCTFPVDLYSYAIVLWEIVTAAQPYQDVKLEHGAQIHGFYEKVRNQGLRPRLEGITPWVTTLLKRLWDYNPSERKDFDQVLIDLANHDYAIVPGVNKAVVQEYRDRLEMAERALK
jgi:serine/threonine protein kinase